MTEPLSEDPTSRPGTSQGGSLPEVVASAPEVTEPEDCGAYYTALHGACGDVLVQLLSSDLAARHSLAHSRIADMGVWLEVLKERPEALVLGHALQDYQYSLLSVAHGQYKQAFAGLRFYLELGLAAVHFSAHELDLRTWLNGEQDIVWNLLVDRDKGVFSPKFAKAFGASLSEYGQQYGAIAAALYRECSEYIHGAPWTAQPHMEFSRQMSSDWYDRSDRVHLVISYSLCLRYLTTLNKASYLKLENIVNDALGHLPAIRAFYEAADRETS